MGDLENEGDRRQAIASLAFESRIYGGASLNPTDQAKSDEFNDADVLPKWFIPARQVELSNHLADGAFGAVYQGRWLDTDVVIKQVLTDQNQDEFRREVDLWFSLNHDYLIKLYGACHEGRAFFVCEQATHGTLATYANGKPRLKIWECIYEAALGLKYLHERGIVHGDLKGNNILVCEDGVKLADFGLSFIAHHPDAVAGANGALGAYRWKAPECLAGSQPTFASDVYSFGMCIIEVLSGEWPWGKSMPDSAVISNVMEKKLPQQPQTIDSAEWKLISSMCCFDTDRRIIADVVVSYAFNQCRGLESWRWEYLTQ
ncbi:hypothetical protein PR001_g22174 [Phytophthora rubi]|uniref:Protein kinase domain-containing protein n=1 Tax=Phytophthora rubi TaxID=129364 RepID=A0A6A3J0M6_9STRA|nr:hypothetical protein PR001_g22174 [Phytophthora rubi]